MLGNIVLMVPAKELFPKHKQFIVETTLEALLYIKGKTLLRWQNCRVAILYLYHAPESSVKTQTAWPHPQVA